jgi:hypothetical protein
MNHANKLFIKHTSCFFAVVMFLLSCSPTRIVKPLAKGEQAVGANLGGPFITFAGAPIPIPYTSAFYARGLNNKTTAFGSVHLTALAFGVFQTDLGICRELYANQKLQLGISVNPAMQIAIDHWEGKAKFWPQLDLNVYKNWGSQKMLYAGINNWFEPSTQRAHNEAQNKQWYVNPHIGFLYSPRKWSYGIETKWVAPGVSNTPNVVDYIGINQKGAVGVYFQLIRRF